MSDYHKVIFRLEQDDNGYPPVGFEGLWASSLPNGHYKIDNIPFYVLGISPDDEVQAENINGELWFKALVKQSKISIFRLLTLNTEMNTKIRDDLDKLSCKTEYNQKMDLIAVEIPERVSIDPFLNYIMEGKEKGIFDFEEATLRH